MRTATARELTPSRRYHRRLPVTVEVSYTSESNFYMGFTENLSEGGLFVATYDYLPRGSRVEFEFRLPGVDTLIHAKGVVRWVREYNAMADDMIPGMGIQFIEMSPPAMEQIVRRFVATRDPLFYDEF